MVRRLRAPMAGLAALAVLLACARPACAWGRDGHEIVAYIAADGLTPAARMRAAKILQVKDDPNSVAWAMAGASVLPDTEFREEDPSTIPWHFIDLCLQDRESQVPARCPHGACVTAKIDEYARRMRTGDYDRWGAYDDFAFLIHFVGDIHQPLHTANDADEGGNCISVETPSGYTNLHAVWDTVLVRRLEHTDGWHGPRSTAHELEREYASEKHSDTLKPGGADAVAWESTQVARSQIYQALGIPVEPCRPFIHSCINAPRKLIFLSRSYLNRESIVAGHQLAKAGFRLADLLNRIWSAH